MATADILGRRVLVALMLMLALVAVLLSGSFADAAGPAGCQAVAGPNGWSYCHFKSKTGRVEIVAAGLAWYAESKYGSSTISCMNELEGLSAAVCIVGKGGTVYLAVLEGVIAARDVSLP